MSSHPPFGLEAIGRETWAHQLGEIRWCVFPFSGHLAVYRNVSVPCELSQVHLLSSPFAESKLGLQSLVVCRWSSQALALESLYFTSVLALPRRASACWSFSLSSSLTSFSNCSLCAASAWRSVKASWSLFTSSCSSGSFSSVVPCWSRASRVSWSR